MHRGHDTIEPFVGLLFLLLLGAALAALVVGLLMLYRRGSGPAGVTAGSAGGWPATGRPQHPDRPQHPIAAAEQTLAERLARGELDVPDYEQRLAALRRSLPVSPPAANAPPPPAGPPA